MSKTAYIELPLKPEHAEDFANLANSDEGFALTQKQPGFISAEVLIVRPPLHRNNNNASITAC